VFALGVTAYRLVTGEYPVAVVPKMDEEGSWYMAEPGLRSPSDLNPQVDPQLGMLILRMLSLDPRARGTAKEHAEALEALVKRDSQESARVAEPVPPEAAGGSKVSAPIQTVRPLVRARAVMAGSALMLVGVLLVLWAQQGRQVLPEVASLEEHVPAVPGKPDEGPADLGDTAAAAPQASAQEPSRQQAISQDLPPEPLPEQLRPDAKGQCPGRKQVPINGGCWVEYPAANAGECEQNGYVLLKSRCYAPALKSRRKPPPTSDLPQ
jgi:hypothetical protein